VRRPGIGKDEDFAAYVAAQWRRLVRSAVLLGCSLPEAEDLVQTALERCYVKWPQVQRARHRDAYVAQVLLNCLRQSRRRRWWSEQPTADLPEGIAPDVTGRVDDVDAVLRALGSLSAGQREVVVLRYYVHLTETQIAETLGIAPGTVKSRLARGLAALSVSTDLAEGQLP
jgi:RNA polymerase sigma-70 factor (sigma-E family)